MTYQLPRCLKPVGEVDLTEATARGWPIIFNGRYVDTSGKVTNTPPDPNAVHGDNIELDLPPGWSVADAVAHGWQAVLLATGPGPMGIGGPNMDFWCWRTPAGWEAGSEHAGDPNYVFYTPFGKKGYWAPWSMFSGMKIYPA